MPFRDGTGPRGMGSMTGKQAGYCTGYGVQGGNGFGNGFGRGRGMRYRNRCVASFAPGQRPYFDPNIRGFAAPITQEEEKKILQKEADTLQCHMNEVRRRLDELNSCQ